MADIIEVDFQLVWRYPVFIRTGASEQKRIEGPDAALDALNHRWSDVRGGGYVEAKRRCVDALRRRGSAELARQRFIQAAIAAGVLA
ncbi:DUF982 domain-containing protein [Rhizobium lentis]|uniref:DUF982 domain-containing protein n=1 Tax=Rhizobium lentis TaxID=1138194 RepID=A0ABS7I7S2_9HYPH|nr:DUF982 domain-containing protein [Rhizobium lentis]MBX5039418.1 DUF982 domain-containing protein [Rhizobium lentis]MBX5052191.1 DUF982 domain-containing protein [Rhizobium lentis]MBX5071845.1 DUF982 domain-containing protein [Rhizobium lentis]MBX5087865.1 DUF982 domain-containing protein [Rhizobium lentis]MBX5101793.1 DUF982 domain-containing protein [Rhizobium lentis]